MYSLLSLMSRLRSCLCLLFLEDTIGVIRSHKSKDRHYNGQKQKRQKDKQDLQNTTQKTKDRATRTRG